MENVKQKYTPKIIDILAYQQTITNQGNNYTGEKDWALNKIVELIDLAIAERDREWENKIAYIRGFNLSKEDTTKADILDSLYDLLINSKK